MAAEPLAGPVRGVSSGLELMLIGIAWHLLFEGVTSGECGPHLRSLFGFAERRKRRKKKKTKKAMTVFKCRTKRYTSQSTIYFWAFSGGCKSSWHKFLTPTYVFLVGSKWYTKVSRGGEGSALCKGNEISFLLAQPQSPFTYITLSSSMVSIQSHAFTAVETNINEIVLAKEILWIWCVVFSMLVTFAFVSMH